MSGFWSFRRVLTGAILATTVAGTTALLAQTRGGAAPGTAPASAPATLPVDPNAPIAVINDLAINNRFFYDTLMNVAGMRVFQEVFDLTVVQGACKYAGIEMDGPRFQQRMTEEYDKTLQQLNVPPDTSKADREAILSNNLARQGITMIEFRMLMETNAGLRALAKGAEFNGDISVSDADIQLAYEAEYGERRRVHLLSVNDTAIASKVRDLVVTQKKKLEDAAAELKLPAPSEWTISKNATGIGAVRDVTFNLTVGQLSAMTALPTQAGATPQNVMIYLDEIKPDTTKTNPLTDKLKAELKQKVLDVKESQWMNTHKAMLRGSAKVKINDPVLSAQFEAIFRQMQAQAEAAKTQPGGVPGVTSQPAGGVGGIPTPAVPPASMPALPEQLPPRGR